MRLHRTPIALACAIFASLLGGAVQAMTVGFENGGFEQPGSFAGSLTTLNAGDTGLTGWTIGGAGVDLIRDQWAGSEGVYSIDLNGVGPGSISQEVENLQAGASYDVIFDLAGNPDGGPDIKTLDIAIAGQSVAFAFDTSGRDETDLGWVTQTFTFAATSQSETLTFTGTSDGASGAALDNIRIVQTSNVPVPASLLLIGTAMAGLGMVRSRRLKR